MGARCMHPCSLQHAGLAAPWPAGWLLLTVCAPHVAAGPVCAGAAALAAKPSMDLEPPMACVRACRGSQPSCHSSAGGG